MANFRTTQKLDNFGTLRIGVLPRVVERYHESISCSWTCDVARPFISRITTPFTFTFRRFHFHNPFHFHFQALSLSNHFQLTFKAPFPALSGLSPFGPLSNLLINIFYRVA
ncbi:uncharacterized protein LACBIDRAFT_312342 [Laccaria bicolor S238N-H82]|uniref:Predicted protein n=1 Tax=Laccaria bicolor (strain S238N-H82 / ATCC MYA-4686) TaxID=486041 RepID=B0DVZ8_LACBS|nr:uncharacterized protein LACBIDRAFT_312342 [Laccaria bicolor S238N-H82]EDR01260.1 predicted protein [Laccaria bicolor S238N-H82]|eukprot:XP_001888136.1 predicted protein [Laccaria bicolor S238N-H82]